MPYTMNAYRNACLASVANYRILAMRQDTGKHVYIYLAQVWLKRARLATKAINKREIFKVKVQHG